MKSDRLLLAVDVSDILCSTRLPPLVHILHNSKAERQAHERSVRSLRVPKSADDIEQSVETPRSRTGCFCAETIE